MYKETQITEDQLLALQSANRQLMVELYEADEPELYRDMCFKLQQLVRDYGYKQTIDNLRFIFPPQPDLYYFIYKQKNKR